MSKNKKGFKEKYLKHLDSVWEIFKSPIVAIAEVIKTVITTCVNEANNYDTWTKEMRGNK